MFCIELGLAEVCMQPGGAPPEQKLETADKGSEIIVTLYILERVQCQAAKNLRKCG